MTSKILPGHLEKWLIDIEFVAEDKKDHHEYFQPEHEKFRFVIIRQLHLFLVLQIFKIFLWRFLFFQK